jgi:hypothetical protein
MTNEEKLILARNAQVTDNAWQEQLEKQFGKRAGDIRYRKEGRGEAGTALNVTYLEREAARVAWENTWVKRDVSPLTTE